MTHAAPDPLYPARALLTQARTLLEAEPPAAAELLRNAAAMIAQMPPDMQAEAEGLQASSLFAQDEYGGAAQHARRAADLFRSTDDTGGLVAALLQEAEIQVADEHYEQVSQLADEIRTLLRGRPSGPLAQALNMQAMALFLQGKYREAGAVTTEEAAVRESVQDYAGHAKCLNNLGLIHIELGDLPTALGHLRRCFNYIRSCPEPLESLASACQINIGNIHQILHEHDKATDSFRQGVEAAQRAGHVANEIAGLTGIGMVAKDQGHHPEALEVLGSALALAQANGRRHNEAEILDTLGQVYAGLEQRQLALDTFGHALEIAAELGALPGQQNALFNLARVQMHSGHPELAVVPFETALTYALHSGSERAALEIHEQLAAALLATGQAERAAQQFAAALALERTLGERERQETFLKLTADLEVERAKHQAETYRLLNETAQQARSDAEDLVRARTAELEQAQREIIARLGIAGEYRDDRTGAHTQRVSTLAATLAAAIGLPDEDVQLIRLASRLHDIGKIGVPDGVLLKAGRLTPEEFSIMRQHTVIGARVLEGGQSALMRLAEEIARTHHERWDGSGYPAGLSGDRIPLPGRIVALVDVWDALTTERPYKAAWSYEEAYRDMAAQSGKQFDPHLLEVFLEMISDLHARGTLPTE